MMNFKVEVNLDEFMEHMGGESLDSVLAEIVKEDIFKALKRDPRYKKLVLEKTEQAIANLDVFDK